MRKQNEGGQRLRIRDHARGVPNLDVVLGGGLPVGSFNLIAGGPGTGKTLLALQFLIHGARLGGLANTLRRAIVVLKTRGSDHASDIREYVITDKGIEILPIDPSVSVPVLSMQQYAHVLTSFPVPRTRPPQPPPKRTKHGEGGEPEE